ncbi:uncharacterized protein LOC144021015 isoform X2 [Festucalex cinctus]
MKTSPDMDDIGPVQRSTRGKKRASMGEQPGHFVKRQCNRAQASRTDVDTFSQDHSKTLNYHALITDHVNKRAGISNEGAYNSVNKAHYSGQKIKTDHHVNRQQQRKQTNYQKGRQQKQGQPQNRNWRHQTKNSRNPGGRTHHRNETQTKKYFSPQFKEQNIMVVNEQMVCRHFIHGNCIKGDSCQMQHIEAHNDLIKKLCKYYLQGTCNKGEQCPFMHKSFPCKFFHKKGNCSKGKDCRFSHEPLDDITTKLLNEAIELQMELAKQAEQSSFQPETVDEPEVTQVPNSNDIPQEENKGSAKLGQPFRFNFYNSAESNANNMETCRTEEEEDATEEDAQSREPARQSPSLNLCPEPPVLYSVEAVLGPQSSVVCKTLISENPVSSGCSGSTNHCEVPYSVDVVLGASKSTKSFTLGHSSSPTTAAATLQIASYTPTGERSSASLNNKSSDLFCTHNEANTMLRETWKRTATLQVVQDNHGDNTPVPTTTLKTIQEEKSGEYMKTGPTSHKASLHCSKEEKQHLPTDMTYSVQSCNGGFQRLFSSPPHLTYTPKHFPPVKSRQLHQANDLHPRLTTPKRFAQLKESTCVPAALVNPSSETGACGRHLPLQCAKNTKSAQTSGAPQSLSGTATQHTTDCLGPSTPGWNKTLKMPFKSLFAGSSIPTTSSTHNHFSQSVTVSPKPTNINCQDSSIEKIVEPDKPHASFLCGLFNTPLGQLEAPPRASQTNHSYQPGDPATLSDAAHSETPVSNLASQTASSGENDRLGNAHRATTPSRPCTLAAHQQLPVTPPSASVDCTSAATSNSVLKTLFQSLSPYQQDRL